MDAKDLCPHSAGGRTANDGKDAVRCQERPQRADANTGSERNAGLRNCLDKKK